MLIVVFNTLSLSSRRAGIVKVVASEPENGLLLNALLVVIRGLTSGCRERLYEELLASGAVPKICNSLESPELNEGESPSLSSPFSLITRLFTLSVHLHCMALTLTL